MNNLNDLRTAMLANDAATLDQHGQWSSELPTFGGDAPTDTTGVWSWDETHLLVGTCADDLELVNRTEVG